MAKNKYDYVVEAVHYNPDGQVEWVRAFERRGPTFSDHVLIERKSIIERLKAGNNFMVGKRVPRMGGTFEVSVPLRLVNASGKEVLVTGDQQADQDHLEGVPVL